MTDHPSQQQEYIITEEDIKDIFVTIRDDNITQNDIDKLRSRPLSRPTDEQQQISDKELYSNFPEVYPLWIYPSDPEGTVGTCEISNVECRHPRQNYYIPCLCKRLLPAEHDSAVASKSVNDVLDKISEHRKSLDTDCYDMSDLYDLLWFDENEFFKSLRKPNKDILTDEQRKDILSFKEEDSLLVAYLKGVEHERERIQPKLMAASINNENPGWVQITDIMKIVLGEDYYD